MKCAHSTGPRWSRALILGSIISSLIFICLQQIRNRDGMQIKRLGSNKISGHQTYDIAKKYN